MKKVVIFALSAALAVFAFSSVQAADAVKNLVTVNGFHFEEGKWETADILEPFFCKVSGKGLQKEGKKVTLKVKPVKLYSFAGWCDENGDPLEMATDYRSPSLSFVMPCADTNFYVRLIKKTDDTKCVISLTGAEFKGVTTIDEGNTNLTIAAGAPYEMSVSVDSYTLTTLKVKGLPKGLKFNSKTRKISGVPTKAGTFTVTVKATNASKNQKELKFAITVLPVEDWAVGTFDGAYTNGADVGTFTLTVKKTGAISGKLSAGKYTHTFKAKSFDTATVVAKEHITNRLSWSPDNGAITWVNDRPFLNMFAYGNFSFFLDDSDFKACDPYVDAYTATIKVLINSKPVTIPLTFVELNKAVNAEEPNLAQYDGFYTWTENTFRTEIAPALVAESNAGDVKPQVPDGSYLWNDGASVGWCYSDNGAWNSSQRKYDATTGYKVNDLREDVPLLMASLGPVFQEKNCTFISLSAKGALKFKSAEGKKVTVYPSVYEVVNDDRGNYTDFIFSYLKKDKTLDTMTFRVEAK